ncbi:MAG TPA: precorrin-8X methylmutase [Candidatus Angelobacter sp.]|nr:precorrin-8X methylmutase [Candidatus Angelobacter sp.]
MARRSDLILSLSKDARRPSPSAEPRADETTNTPREYLRDPDAIYRESFAIIRREAKLAHLPPDVADITVRLIHACGMTDIVADLAFTPEVAARARAALATGAPILCDSAMVAAGMMRARLPARNEVICTLDDARVPELARALKTTRSAAAVELWGERLAGAVVAIGNAPTALFHLLELLGRSNVRPAAILAFPVGFVGAAESKQALIDMRRDVPFLTLKGRRGGSALAAAAVNALLVGVDP